MSNRSSSSITAEAAVNRSPTVVSSEAGSPRYDFAAPTRQRVGHPDYSLHPAFVRPGSFTVLTDASASMQAYVSQESRARIHTRRLTPLSPTPLHITLLQKGSTLGYFVAGKLPTTFHPYAS